MKPGHAPTTESAPVQSSERADILDILRGFALLGIALANYGMLSYYKLLPPEVAASLPGASVDRWLNYFSTLFLEGKFYSLFSMLFGVGFAVIISRKDKSGKTRLGLFYRRLFILMLFGIVHSLLIWDGDILLFYGLVGMLLPLFTSFENKTTIIIAGVLLLSPLVFDTAKILSNGKLNIATPVMHLGKDVDKQLGITEENVSAWLANNDSYMDQLRWNQAGSIWTLYFRMEGNRIPKVLAMFLLGMCAGRAGLHINLTKYKSKLPGVQRIGFAIGIPAGIMMIYVREKNMFLPDANGIWGTLAYALNVTSLSLAYAATLCLWYLKPAMKSKLNFLRPMGRMALTNYITQSVVGVILFAPAFLALGGFIGPTVYFPIAIAVYSFQMGASHVWFRYFDYGPLEWIWRQLTYGRRLRILRSSPKNDVLNHVDFTAR